MAYLGAFGHYVPERVVTNLELAEKLSCSPTWIADVSGIEERRYAAPTETIVSAAREAATRCLDRAGLSAADIGIVLVACSVSDRRFPGPAASVAQALGMQGTPAIDLPIASAGSLVALSLADSLAAHFGTVLVIGVEKLSQVLETFPHPAGTGILFGDGAGACLVRPDRGWARILGSVLHSDGQFADDLRLEFEGPIQMEGRSVILQALRKLPSVVEEVLAKFDRGKEEVEVYLPHQANLNLLGRVAAALDVPAGRFFTNVSRYGNTSTASMLIAAAEWLEKHHLPPGRLACFTAFGAGFHWGALLAEGVNPA